ncbi:unnamed protein product [Alternaria alternata]
MCKSEGALGKDSLLLQYPFDFMPFVPFVAAKRRHWLVFWASFATVVTTFGIVPLQAGIFSTARIAQRSTEVFDLSEQYMPLASQATQLSSSFAQSAYGILELNETMPAFTSHNFTLAPFKMKSATAAQNGTWMVSSTAYFLDLECEEGRPWKATSYMNNRTYDMEGFNSSRGTYYHSSIDNNNTIGAVVRSRNNETYRLKEFSTSFAAKLPSASHGYSWLALPMYHSSDAFFASFVSNKRKGSDPAVTVTAIFCNPSYHKQSVTAIVDSHSNAVINIIPIGSVQKLPRDMFDYEIFEAAMEGGVWQQRQRDNALPLGTLPRYMEKLYRTNLTLAITDFNGLVIDDLPPMAAMAMSGAKDHLRNLLEPKALANAYRAAYQLLFARAMVDVLRTNFTVGTTELEGVQLQSLDAVVMQTSFTYLVGGLLAAVSVAALSMLYISLADRARTASTMLSDDPDSMAATMAMVADAATVLNQFDDLDCSSTRYLEKKLGSYVFRMDERGVRLCSDLTSHRSVAPELGSPDRPVEYRLRIAVPFTSFFPVLAVVLAVLFVKSQPQGNPQGLPLPFQDQSFQQALVTNYIPVAIATFIEPMWILYNRLLCLLQPVEQMRRIGASAEQSITLSYSTVPPQLTILKAIRARHFMLAMVCGMTLMANLLATAFAGLFFEAAIEFQTPVKFSLLLHPQFTAINGSAGPGPRTPYFSTFQGQDQALFSGAHQGGTGEDHFLVSESNYTRNTSLPGWTDDHAFYLPFGDSVDGFNGGVRTYKARTTFFSAKPNCRKLELHRDFRIRYFRKPSNPKWASLEGTNFEGKDFNVDDGLRFHAKLITPDNTTTSCVSKMGWSFGSPSRGTSKNICREGPEAGEMVSAIADSYGNLSSYGTLSQQNLCRSTGFVGWTRANVVDCSLNSPWEEDLDRPWEYEDAKDNNTFVIACQPSLVIGSAAVHVDSAGRMLRPAEDIETNQDQSPEALASYFSNDPSNLVAQSNLFIFQDMVSRLHWDSYASEMIHYHINREAGSLKFTDPNQPLPTMDDIEDPLERAYRRLFAIWLGVNKDYLFLPSNGTTLIPGVVIASEERLFFTVPLFVISEIILGVYFVVAIFVFVRRPGRYLPRLPTSIAAIVSLFASSAAVKDLQGTSQMTNKEREKHLKHLDNRYGYGSYISNSVVHVGIEKTPYVHYMKEVTFVGSKVQKEIRKQNEKACEAGSSRSTGDMSACRRGGARAITKMVSATAGVVWSVPSKLGYTPLETRDRDKGLTIPLEEIPLSDQSPAYGDPTASWTNEDRLPDTTSTTKSASPTNSAQNLPTAFHDVID